MATTPSPPEHAGGPAEPAEPLALKGSGELSQVPAPRPEPVPTPPPAPATAPEAQPAAPVPQERETRPLSLKTLPHYLTQSTPPSTWGMASVALIAAVGWLYERRRRRLTETEKDSLRWAGGELHGASIVTTAGGLDDILPDSPDPGEAARNIYVTAIGETNSRREATLIDLHQLEAKLSQRREHGDFVAGVLLLQQHLVDFRYTSPWVFLELLELYRRLDREPEWEVARAAFRDRFGQNAPAWTALSTEDIEFSDDRQLSGELERVWPHRAARMFILRWMLGEHEARHKNSGPPLLGLGIYRDMMFLDKVLDECLEVRPAPPVDSLL